MPFGMQMAGGTTPTANPNKRLYNGGSEWQDDIDGLADYYSTFFREYDAVIGRFNGVDILAEITANTGTYAFAYDNPIMVNDQMGNLASASTNYTSPTMRDILDRYASDPFSSGWGDNNGWDGGGTYSDFKERFDYLGSPGWRGEMANANSGDGFQIRTFDNDAEAFVWGVDYLDKYNAWGRNGFANSLEDAKKAYYANGGQNLLISTITHQERSIIVRGSINNGKWETRSISQNGNSFFPIDGYLIGTYKWKKTGAAWTAQVNYAGFSVVETGEKLMKRITPLTIRFPEICIQAPPYLKDEYKRNEFVNRAWNNALETFYGELYANFGNNKLAYNDEAAKQEFKNQLIFQISLVPASSISFGACLNIPVSIPVYGSRRMEY